jgi:hypothetical protein
MRNVGAKWESNGGCPYLCISDDTSVKEKPVEKSKEKKVVKPVRKIQKVTQLSNPECKTGWFSVFCSV